MSTPTHIRVTAPEGVETPIHPRDGLDQGLGLLFVIHGEIRRVGWSADVRRAVNRGDLIPCDMNGDRVTIDQASCTVDLPGGRIVIARKETSTP